MKKILENLKIFCTTETRMTLKKLNTPTKHINTLSISLLTFMTSRSRNRKLKLNSRAIRALGLLKVLQNHQKFLKNTTPKNEETYKTYENLLKPLKRVQRKSLTQKYCTSLKVH